MSIVRQKVKGRWRYRWQAYYTDPAGKRRRKSSKWFSSKAECEESLQVDPDRVIWLRSQNPAYEPIPVNPDDDFRVLGLYRFKLSKER